MDAKEAMNAYTNACKKKDQQDEQILEQESAELFDFESPGSQVNEEPAFEKDLDVRLSDSSEQTKVNVSQTNTLESKMDTVIHILNKLSSKIEHPKTIDIPDISTMLQEQSKDKSDLDGNVDWSKIENIIDLTTKVPSVRFFAGQDGQKGCVRCQVCFDYHCSRDSGLKKCDPSETDDNGEAAAKHIRKYISLIVLFAKVSHF